MLWITFMFPRGWILLTLITVPPVCSLWQYKTAQSAEKILNLNNQSPVSGRGVCRCAESVRLPSHSGPADRLGGKLRESAASWRRHRSVRHLLGDRHPAGAPPPLPAARRRCRWVWKCQQHDVSETNIGCTLLNTPCFPLCRSGCRCDNEAGGWDHKRERRKRFHSPQPDAGDGNYQGETKIKTFVS